MENAIEASLFVLCTRFIKVQPLFVPLHICVGDMKRPARDVKRHTPFFPPPSGMFSRPRLPACAASVGPEPARHAVCTQPLTFIGSAGTAAERRTGFSGLGTG